MKRRYNNRLSRVAALTAAKTKTLRRTGRTPGAAEMGGEDIAVHGNGRYTNNNPGLRNTPPGSGTGGTHDIYNDVCRNSLDDDVGGSRPGPIKYGVD